MDRTMWMSAAVALLAMNPAAALADAPEADEADDAVAPTAVARADERAPRPEKGSSDGSSGSGEKAKPTEWSKIGVGLSFGANGAGPTVAFRPIYDGTISLTIVPVVTPNLVILNGGLKYDHVVARSSKAALYLDGSIGLFYWTDLITRLAPAAGVGVHWKQPYWELAEVWAEVNLTGWIYIGGAVADSETVPRSILLPLPSVGVNWYF